ncbi:hypothetical protein CROQUDRAFT_85987 [Cronartium quercuum f. sp. fusiforme G11]|uniref:Uncharacterized protein n=1 Tax=Cronartium quercuum f. sp. fusiforme G11 TaxID=708437 RepID=A0A9P6TGY6_9BASI|nr:hypothetical protein CROQUDRAFT_85987 [Cronartium quercuum f. sp. fusiforme G11]
MAQPVKDSVKDKVFAMRRVVGWLFWPKLVRESRPAHNCTGLGGEFADTTKLSCPPALSGCPHLHPLSAIRSSVRADNHLLDPPLPSSLLRRKLPKVVTRLGFEPRTLKWDTTHDAVTLQFSLTKPLPRSYTESRTTGLRATDSEPPPA